MIVRRYLILSLILTLLSFTEQQKLDLTKYETKHYPVRTGTWKDLLDVVVECPNKGVLKNFILRKKDGYFWYEYQCYSSLKLEVDYGEPIIKDVRWKSTHNWESSLKDSIQAISGFGTTCHVDYGLSIFSIVYENGKLRRRPIVMD